MNLSEIKSVKENADIIRVISHFLPLQHKGLNYISRCPFHNEKSKSFTVNAKKNIFKCFGCGVKGDAIDFVAKQRNIPFKEAVHWVAEFQNITLEAEYSVTAYIEPQTSYLPLNLITPYTMDNNFIQWLKTVFPDHSQLPYPISTTQYWNNAVCFWYVDKDDQVRSGKVMQYNPENGKRIKEPEPLVTWVHKVMRIPDYNMKICLFGENLLKLYPNYIVCLVESEKTAIVASIRYPKFLWLAFGSLTNFTVERCMPLTGRRVILYPDVGAEKRWQAKMEEIQPLLSSIQFSLKVTNSTVIGYDLCDYIVDNL